MVQNYCMDDMRFPPLLSLIKNCPIVFNHLTNCCTSVHTHEDCLWLVEEEKKHQYQQSFFLFMARWRPHLHSQLQKSLNWHIKHVPTSSWHNLSPLHPLFDMINSKTQKSYCFNHICGKSTKSKGILSLHACMHAQFDIICLLSITIRPNFLLGRGN